MRENMTASRAPHARTVAEEIAAMCSGALAYSLTHGYAVVGPRYALQLGTKRRLFPPSTPTKQRRNKEGRVTYSEHAYSDGSRLVFRWHPVTGPRLDIFRK
jgi:hypothetical protein